MAEKVVESPKVARYIGTADVREIDKSSWDNAGVTDQTKVTWNKRNKWQVPLTELSDSAVAYLENDPGFVVADYQP